MAGVPDCGAAHRELQTPLRAELVKASRSAWARMNGLPWGRCPLARSGCAACLPPMLTANLVVSVRPIDGESAVFDFDDEVGAKLSLQFTFRSTHGDEIAFAHVNRDLIGDGNRHFSNS